MVNNELQKCLLTFQNMYTIHDMFNVFYLETMCQPHTLYLRGYITVVKASCDHNAYFLHYYYYSFFLSI